MIKSIYFRVSGRVQGVFFRASTRNKARSLSLQGWVRNCVDGKVEGMAQGEPDNLEQLIAWLKEGPELARVDEVIINNCDEEQLSDFTIR